MIAPADKQRTGKSDSRPEHKETTLAQWLRMLIADYAELIRRRELIKRMASGQLAASLHRTVLGSFWLLLMPLFQILIYYSLVVVIFKRGSGPDYFYILAMGIMHYALFQQTLAASTSSIIVNSGMLLQIKINPIVLIGVSFVRSMRTGFLGILVFFAFLFISGRSVTWNFLYYPVVMIFLLMLAWSLSIASATISVYLRDFGNVLQFMIQFLRYACPIIYPTSFVPVSVEHIYYLNPVAVIFGLLQWMFFGERMPPAPTILTAAIFILALFFMAHAVLATGRKGFTKAF